MESLGPGLGAAASRPARETGRAARKTTDNIVGADAELGRSHHWHPNDTDTGTSAREGGSRVPARAPMAVTDLSHMPLLGDLLDAADAGQMSIGELTRAFAGLERRYGPFHLDNVRVHLERGATVTGEALPGKLFMRARVRDDTGQNVGRVRYDFWRDKNGLLVAGNEVAKLKENFRGKGFSTAFSTATEAYFRRCGVDRIEVHASLDDGGYAWAKAGYDWNPDPTLLEASANLMRARIDALIGYGIVSSPADAALLDGIKQRFDGPVAGYPSPQELTLLTGDDPHLGKTLMRGSNWYGMKKL
ncbi:hypothetical protein [Nocardia sp. NPDC004750]